MIDDDDNETYEQMVKRYAYNRWQMRMHFKWKLEDTADDDYRIAQEIARKAMYERHDIA